MMDELNRVKKLLGETQDQVLEIAKELAEVIKLHSNLAKKFYTLCEILDVTAKEQANDQPKT